MERKMSVQARGRLRATMLAVMTLSLVAAVVSAALYIRLSPEVFRVAHVLSVILFAASASAVLLMDICLRGYRKRAAARRRSLYFRVR